MDSGPKFNYGSLISLICGILSCIPKVYTTIETIFGFYTLVVIFALPLAALVFGIGGIVRSIISIQKYGKTGLRITGMIFSILGTIGSCGPFVLLLIWFVSLMKDVNSI